MWYGLIPTGPQEEGFDLESGRKEPSRDEKFAEMCKLKLLLY